MPGELLDGERLSAAIASREQKVWRRMWSPPVTFSPARRWARRIHFAKSTAVTLS